MKWIYFIGCTFILISCQSKTQEIIYEKDGLIREKKIYFSKNQSNYKYLGYYDNGQLAAEGMCILDKKEGVWTYWFKDGDKKYSAVYEDGKINYDYRNRKLPQIVIEDRLQPGVTTYIKVLNLYEGESLLVSKNAELDFSENDYFTYKVTPLYGDSVYFYYDVLESLSINKNKQAEYAEMLEINVEDRDHTRYYQCETFILNPFDNSYSIIEDLQAERKYKVFIYYPNGEIKTIGSFRNLKKEGYWIDFYLDGEQRNELIYMDGHLTLGTEDSYYPSIEIDSVTLMKNVPQKIRIINLLPNEKILFSDNVIAKKLINDPMYDYEVTAILGDTAIISYKRLYPFDENVPQKKDAPLHHYNFEDSLIIETIDFAHIPIYETTPE